MTTDTLADKAVSATKWSLITQVVSKLIKPVTTLVLAHILSPESFGIVATATMVTSLADTFSDAGFQKYLIQHEFKNEESLRACANVAFWTNMLVSIGLWLIIVLFGEEIAVAVGCAGYELMLAVAGISLPLTALISVQTGIYQRRLDFRTLFSSNVASSIVILFSSVPLALLGADYWSLIFGTIAGNVVLVVWLSLKSDWHPVWGYKLKFLKKMLSFSVWTLLESLASWLTSWAGTFILGITLNSYYLGLYKTSTSLVTSITAVVTSSVIPVAFSMLSRLQSNRAAFDAMVYKIQYCLALFLVPLAFCIFVFKDSLVYTLLGEKWMETSLFVGLYGAACSLVIVFGYVASEAYRSLGQPRLSLLVQIAYLAVLIPTLYLSSLHGYEVMSVAYPAVRAFAFTAIHFVVCKVFLRLSPWRMLANLKFVFLVSTTDALLFYFAVGCIHNYFGQLLLILPAVVLYFALITAIPETRTLLFELLNRFGIKNTVSRLLSKENS